MALPWSRYYTYAAQQVLGVSVFNIVQDLAVAFFAKGRRKQQSLQLPVFGRRGGGWPHTLGDKHVKAGGAGSIHYWPLHLPVGTTVTTAYLGYNKAGASAIAFRLRRQSHSSGAVVTVVTVNLTSAAGSWFYDPLNVGTIILDGFSYWLEAVAGQTNDLAQRCELVYSYP
jgi:hypothetical protein